MKFLFAWCLMLIFCSLADAQQINFNNQWKFQLGDQTDAMHEIFDDHAWRVLDLPHDWSIEGNYRQENPMADRGGYLPAGIGWYRKTINVPENWKGKHVEIAFDGIFMNSIVWANGIKLGTRPYGWISFAYDISAITDTAKQITFAVRVDNQLQPAARWYTGSGIYANTWLRVKDKLHISTKDLFIQAHGEEVQVNGEIINEYRTSRDVQCDIDIRDAMGVTVAHASQPLQVQALGVENFQSSLNISNPVMWSPEQPYLYTVITQVVSKGVVLDAQQTRMGIRHVEWKAATGFWLNGKNIKLHGVCNHQDAGALGAAVPDKILRYRLQQLKDMGCNAIRTAHNPQTPQFYDMCDEMGLLVMDEIFDGWKRKAENDYGARFFDEWWKKDLTDWILRDRNHPSVIIYSLGNETSGEVARAMVARCHALDSTRRVTSGHSSSQYMDVLGVNGSSEKTGWLEAMPKDRPFVGTENTHTWQVRGFYRTQTWYRDGYPNQKQKPYFYPDLTDTEIFTYDWIDDAHRKNFKQVFNSSYDNAMVRLTSRQNIQQVRDIPYFSGSFRWTGYDYIGEAGYVHGGWPFKAFMGGAIDMANFKKDLYYLYQSQWSHRPMVHILPHWTHPTMPSGTKVPVWVYSNCDSVELFLNDTSLGIRQPGSDWSQMPCQWAVGYQPGQLKAVGYVSGAEMVREEVTTAGPPASIRLSTDGEPMAPARHDVVQVRVATTDKRGNFYPYGENRTYFHILGQARVRALDNGSPVDLECHYQAQSRRAFFGLTRAYIEALSDSGEVSLVAGSILGEKRQITSKQVTIDVRHLDLRGHVSMDFEAFFTLDGSEPTTHATRYVKAFEVAPGTTVRALVVGNKKPLFSMKEQFGTQEGMVWHAAVRTAVPGGAQAEEAAFSKAVIDTSGTGYEGKGYLYFGRNGGGYVEWQHQNETSKEVEVTLELLYSASKKVRPQYETLLSVNGRQQVWILPAEVNFRRQWQRGKKKVRLHPGANTIRISVVQDDGLCIDALHVK